jgi:hypothetical protein
MLSGQTQKSPPPGIQGTLTHENVYSNPALGMTMVLPRKWQFVDDELQARLQDSSAPSETPPDPNCTGPLCHPQKDVRLITKPGQAPVDYILFTAFQLSPQYRNRERFPLKDFAQTLLTANVSGSGWIPDGELTPIQIDGKPAYRLLMHTSGLVKKKGYGYVFDANGYVVLFIGTTTYMTDSSSQLQAAIENMKLHTQAPAAR